MRSILNWTVYFAYILTFWFCSSFVAAEALAQDEKQYIWEIRIQGAKIFSEADVKDALVSQNTSRIPLVGAAHEYDPVTFQTDLKRIEHFYQRHGYYQISVDRTEVRPCSRKGRVCITILISEGEPTRISRVAVRVNGRPSPPVPSDELAAVFQMAVGDVFDHNRYMARKEALLRHLKEKSYPLPKLEGEAHYDKPTNTIAVELDVTPGTAARIGHISFRGLDQILPEDAARRLPIRTGMFYNPDQFEDTEALLADLDVFRSIDVDLKPRSSDPSIVDVIYHVREKALKTLQFGTGISIENSRQEARLRGEWINRNFYNKLRHFSVRGEPRYAVLPSIFRPDQRGPLGTAEAAMRHPAFPGPRQNLRTAIGFDSDLEQGYQWFGPRLTSVVDHRLTRRVTLSGGYGFRYLRFYNVQFVNTASTRLVPAALLFNREYRLGYLTQTIAWDRRDQVIEPHRGFYADLDLSESVPPLGSAFKYFRIEPELRNYFPITRGATLATKVSYGQMLPWGGRGSPITERFYGGGANNHRGFAYHRLSPMARTDDNRTVPVGGDVGFLFQVEERVELFTLGKQWVIGAVFLDGGDVVERPSLLDLGKLHYAVGGGLRYETPIGILRADVGVRLNRLDEFTGARENPDPGRRFAIHVSFGEAF